MYTTQTFTGWGLFKRIALGSCLSRTAGIALKQSMTAFVLRERQIDVTKFPRGKLPEDFKFYIQFFFLGKIYDFCVYISLE